MSSNDTTDEKAETGDNLVVRAGSITVLTQVGAGRAYIDVPQGATVPKDISDEDRERFTASGAIGKRDDDSTYTGAAARPVAGEVEPDEIDTDVIPGGTVEQVLAWVGDDLARARVARHEELAKGDKARQSLLKALAGKMTEVETEPPAVPESFKGTPDAAPAPVGGVAVPDEDPGAMAGTPADKLTKAAAPRARRPQS